MAEFEAIEPEHVQVELVIGEERREVRIEPLRVGKLPGVIQKLGPVLPKLQQAKADEEIISLIMSHAEEFISVVGEASSLSADDVSGLMLDDFIRLAIEVVRVNADFFARKVAPLIRQIQGSIPASTGTTASSD